MRETKTIVALRTVRVFNNYEFYGDRPYIWHRANAGSRDPFPSAWRVSRRGFKLSDWWGDYGAKSFSHIGREDGKAALADAQQWASETFGVAEWAKDPFGSYGPADYVRAHLELLLAAAADLAEEQP